MKLVIVESPTKARTLSRFLGRDYQILASMGHVRDLPRKKLSVDTEHGFKPVYAAVEGKEKTISKLKQAAKKSKEIILATDSDREGEAIAWHVAWLLKEKKQSAINNQQLTISRITFHEITKSAIEKALKNPGKINMKLVYAQQARRVLDRLVGYKLSPLLWRKIRRGLSAGRVQSVVVRLIVEREREIEKFIRKKYWTIEVVLGKTKKDVFSAVLDSKEGQKYEKTNVLKLFAGSYSFRETSLDTLVNAEKTVTDLKKQKFIVSTVKGKEVKRRPFPPFITSTLQQSASRAFGFSGKRTMRTAQKLYENGFITYHRTDSTFLANQAIKQIRDYIEKSFGDNYLPAVPRMFKTKTKRAQEAHEAIRPTRISSIRQLADQSSKLRADEAKLYELIFKRAIACQMADALFKQNSVDIQAGPYLLKGNGVKVLFDGFLKLYPKQLRDRLLPDLKPGDHLQTQTIEPIEHETQAPPRYNEASLIKTLESKGIGRPSTYAPVVSVVQARQYVEKKEGSFYPTNVGMTVNDFLVKYFGNIVDISFTAKMEDDLDKVAHAEKKWAIIMGEFYHPFAKKLEKVAKEAKRAKIPVEKIGKKCPECKKGDQVIRLGRFGKFLSCSHFPDCKWKAVYNEKLKGIRCPECRGDILVRRTRKGKTFYGCSKWPKCKWASWRKPRSTGEKPASRRKEI